MTHFQRLLCLGLSLAFALPHAAPALERQPASVYHARREALASRLKGGVAILFAGEQPLVDFMPYRQDEDFYYLTGWNEPGAALLVQGAAAAEGERPARPYREVLLLPTRNLRFERFTGVKLDAATPGAAATAGVDEVQPMLELPAILNKIVSTDRSVARALWSETDSTEAKSALSWTAATLGTTEFPAINDVRALTAQLRAVKDPGEIELIRKATNASIVAQRAMMQAIHPGASERAVAGLLINKMMQEGCERPSYSPIIGSGVNSTVLHYSDNSGTMQSGDVVVVDAAGEYSMYASDITRTMPVNGHFTARQREIYDIVLGAQRAAMAAFVAGKSKINDPMHRLPEALDTAAYDYMNAHGKDLHGKPLGQYFIHGLGHLVGINVHDPYDYSKPLEKGMVFTIEPGVYIPEEHIGVRIEDIVYVDNDGKLVNLTEQLPHTADDVEAAMKK